MEWRIYSRHNLELVLKVLDQLLSVLATQAKLHHLDGNDLP